MEWWINKYKQLDIYLDVNKSKKLFKIGVLLLIPFFIMTNSLEIAKNYKVFYDLFLYIIMLNISLSLFLMSFLFRKEHWILSTFHSISAYGVIDSLLDNGYGIKFWEILLLFIIMFDNYLKFKSGNNN